MSDDPRRTGFCTPRCYRACQCSRWPDMLDRWGNPVNHGQGGGDVYYYIEFDGDSAFIDCGDDASIDNIWTTTTATVDLWLRVHSVSDALSQEIITKGDWGLYLLPFAGANHLSAEIVTDAVDAQSSETADWDARINEWHHVTMEYTDIGDRKIYLAIDGAWVAAYNWQTAGTGNVTDDSAIPLYIGAAVGPASLFDGDIQWLRISDNLRWPPGVAFVSPAMCAPPAVDANTTELWIMDEGAGVITAASMVPVNVGAMTDCVWKDCLAAAPSGICAPPGALWFYCASQSGLIAVI